MLHSLLLVAIAVAGRDLRIEAGTDATRPTVTVRLPASLVKTLPEGKVSNKAGETILRFELLSAKGTSLLGHYERKGEMLTFTPRFALAAGEGYRATFMNGIEKQTAQYFVPVRKAEAAARIDAVFPSGDELPANALKFYLHFSRPMREGPAIFDRIRLLDDRGESIEDPWRRTELWNDDATRLTLWVHPGRIKEGVNLRDDLGPVLLPNRKYTLAVDKLLDARGEPLGGAFQKAFKTTAVVRTAIDVRDWTVQAPEPGTRQPLKVTFPRPLDRALLSKFLSLTTASGAVIEGEAAIGAKEQAWSFTPAKVWASGDYLLTADERLEDLAGNTMLRPFDLDLKAPPMKPLPRSISIRISSKSR